jgi:hypothetical protein
MGDMNKHCEDCGADCRNRGYTSYCVEPETYTLKENKR